MRISAAVAPVPTTSTGIHMCCMRSTTLPQLQPALMKAARDTVRRTLCRIVPSRQVHQGQREEEVRNRQSQKAEEGGDVVADRILPDRASRFRSGIATAQTNKSVMVETTTVRPSRDQITSLTGLFQLEGLAEIAVEDDTA